jgi:hypothetical protein
VTDRLAPLAARNGASTLFRSASSRRLCCRQGRFTPAPLPSGTSGAPHPFVFRGNYEKATVPANSCGCCAAVIPTPIAVESAPVALACPLEAAQQFIAVAVNQRGILAPARTRASQRSSVGATCALAMTLAGAADSCRSCEMHPRKVADCESTEDTR